MEPWTARLEREQTKLQIDVAGHDSCGPRMLCLQVPLDIALQHIQGASKTRQGQGGTVWNDARTKPGPYAGEAFADGSCDHLSPPWAAMTRSRIRGIGRRQYGASCRKDRLCIVPYTWSCR